MTLSPDVAVTHHHPAAGKSMFGMAGPDPRGLVVGCLCHFILRQSKAVLWIEAISSILSQIGCYYLYFVQFSTKVKLTKFGVLIWCIWVGP